MINFKAPQETDFLRTALNQTKSLIFVKDNDFRIVYANEAFLDLFPPEKRNSVIGTTTLEEFPNEEVEGFLKEDRRALKGENTEIIEQVTDYAGLTRTYLTRKIGFTSNNGASLMLGICHDVAKMVAQEKVLAQRNIALEKFTTIAAHDLRSPLNTLISYMDIIKLDEKTTLSATSEQNLNDMRKSALLMMNQVTSLVDLFKNNKSTEEPCPLNETMAEVRYNLSSLIKKSDAKVLTNEMPIILGQPDLFRQLFQNLIENSIKYKSDKPPLVIVRCVESANEYVFEIEDNGLGISTHADPFTLNDNGSTPQRSGIGLTLCKRIIDSFGGKIWVEHTYQDGCKICFSYPKLTGNEKERVYI